MALLAGAWARDAAAEPAAPAAGHGSVLPGPTRPPEAAAKGARGADSTKAPTGAAHDRMGAHNHGEANAHEHEASTELGIDMVFGTGRRIGAPEGGGGEGGEGGEGAGGEGEGGEGGEGVGGAAGAEGGEGGGARVAAFSAVFEASHQFTPAFRAAAFLPFSHGTIRPDGETVFSETVLGNLALGFVFGRDVAPNVGVKMGLLVAAPTASGDRFGTGESGRHRGEMNEWAALTRAYAEDELFVPHRVSAVPSFGVDYRSTDFDVGGAVKMPVLVRDGGVDPPKGSGLSQSGVAVEVIPSAYAFLKIPSARLAIGAYAYAVYFAVDEVRSLRSAEGTTETRVQPVVEPEARLTLDPLHVTLGYITPLGGRLGRYEQRAGGVHLALGAEL